MHDNGEWHRSVSNKESNQKYAPLCQTARRSCRGFGSGQFEQREH